MSTPTPPAHGPSIAQHRIAHDLDIAQRRIAHDLGRRWTLSDGVLTFAALRDELDGEVIDPKTRRDLWIHVEDGFQGRDFRETIDQEIPMSELKGLQLDVFRAPGCDTTRGGVSSRHERLTLVGTIDSDDRLHHSPIRASIFTPRPDCPAVVLRRIGDSVHVVPLGDDGKAINSMAGGNFAHTSDSRLRDFMLQVGARPFYGALSIHDRVEG